MQLAITRPHITVFLPYAFIYKCRPVLLRSPAGSTGRDGAVSGSQPAGENRARANGHSPSLSLSLSLSLLQCLFLWVYFAVSPCLCYFLLLHLPLSNSFLSSRGCFFLFLSQTVKDSIFLNIRLSSVTTFLSWPELRWSQTYPPNTGCKAERDTSPSQGTRQIFPPRGN